MAKAGNTPGTPMANLEPLIDLNACWEEPGENPLIQWENKQKPSIRLGFTALEPRAERCYYMCHCLHNNTLNSIAVDDVWKEKYWSLNELVRLDLYLSFLYLVTKIITFLVSCKWNK